MTKIAGFTEKAGGTATTLHSLPCHVKTDADLRCAVSTYFKPAVSKKSKKGARTKMQAQFRGRSLVGYSHPLPPKMLGLVLKPSSESTDDNDVIVESSFKEVMLWGHDMAPAENDDVLDKARDFTEVMKALHGC
ncbi:hypothetical protein TrVE_jg14139 [Triparma verrucosa]|uniref:Uncharacterized protein n=1 Tax=Triparma verrucosa TaxID=1606542 RepID=A0A9W7C967_9STRA|nr:hypothetical protein TrVE_jg14139 [Triparma verrucosa]